MRFPKVLIIGGPKPETELTMSEAVAMVDKWINIQNAESETATIEIDGFIGESFWEESPNTVKAIKAKLKGISKIKAKKIIVNINSLGGSVSHGLGIHDILATHEASIETNIQSMSASMATIISQAGDVRRMSDNALFLIHQPWGGFIANVTELRQDLENMEKIDGRMFNIYLKRSGGKSTEKDMRSLMDENNGNGKWIDADEAIEMGLVDEAFEPMKAAAVLITADMKAELRLPDIPEGKIPAPPAADNQANTQILDTMKKELLAILATIKGALSTKKEGSDEKTISTENQAVIDNLQSQIDEVGNQEENITTLEASVGTITGERDTAVTDLATKTGELETANATIKTLETDLTKAKGKSTKSTGKEGSEDIDELGGDTLQAQLAADLRKIKGE